MTVEKRPRFPCCMCKPQRLCPSPGLWLWGFLVSDTVWCQFCSSNQPLHHFYRLIISFLQVGELVPCQLSLITQSKYFPRPGFQVLHWSNQCVSLFWSTEVRTSWPITSSRGQKLMSFQQFCIICTPSTSPRPILFSIFWHSFNVNSRGRDQCLLNCKGDPISQHYSRHRKWSRLQ